jgi:mono/diheme cytochrome c family protein
MDARRRLGILTVAAALLLIAAGPLAAQGDAALPDGVTPAMVAQGKKVFSGKGLCVACHGDAGKGGLAPSLRDSVWIHSQGSYGEIVAQVRRGVPAESSATKLVMPPRGGSTISDAELAAVAAYIWSLRLEKGK